MPQEDAEVVILARGYGFANLELNVRVTPETVFQIGSLTKQFTATAVMMLAEEGKVGLSESITRYREGLPARWNGVTVHHLLDHTSGIKSFTSLPDVMARLTFLPTSRDEILALVADEPLEFAPGWRVNDHHGCRSVGHDGTSSGFTAFAEHSLEDDLTVIILTNVVPSNRAQIAKGVIGCFVSNLLPPA